MILLMKYLNIKETPVNIGFRIGNSKDRLSYDYIVLRIERGKRAFDYSGVSGFDFLWL